jgi:hypothetical protein
VPRNIQFHPDVSNDGEALDLHPPFQHNTGPIRLWLTTRDSTSW